MHLNIWLWRPPRFPSSGMGSYLGCLNQTPPYSPSSPYSLDDFDLELTSCSEGWSRWGEKKEGQ